MKTITYMGITRTLKQWSIEWDIPEVTLYRRLQKNPNISLDDLFSKDLRSYNKQRYIKNMTYTS